MKVFVAGHQGLAGSALTKKCQEHQYEVITSSKEELDLRDSAATEEFIKYNKPEWVFIAAAVVGGIKANSTYPVDFLLDNMKIQNNLIESSYRNGVRKLLFLGSNCMYPKLAPQPMSEESLLTGPLELTNEPYAIAKISGLKLCTSFNKQYATDFMTVVPTTLYGPNDNYHKERAHVLPMLLRRFHESKINGDKEVLVWGTGTPMREFLYSEDMAEACLFLMEKHSANDFNGFINIGGGFEVSIKELAMTLKEVVGLDAEIKFDTTKPDGAPRKSIDGSKLAKMGWAPKVAFKEGLIQVYKDFLENPHTRK